VSLRIIEISENGRHLLCERGFLVIKDKAVELGKVPLDDIAALIGSAKWLSYSHSVLQNLSERNIPFIVCGRNFSPIAILWPVEGNYRQSKVMDAQIAASLPLKKRLWKGVVQSKIRQQSVALEAIGHRKSSFDHYISRVKSGDPNNVEAEVAGRYWKLLFGSYFKRDREEEGINTLLNYGYGIIRAGVARAVMCAGLHPGIGIHHKNQNNPMRLVDDLMEPFRPLVDIVAWFANKNGTIQLDKTVKAEFVSLLHLKLIGRSEASTSILHMRKLATSLAQVYLGEQPKITLPPTALPLQLYKTYSNLKCEQK
jgi:CRISP-associated protein Cas1